MEIRNDKQSIEGSQPRRFSAGRATAKPGANSFSAALKKAASEAKGAADPASARPEAAPETASMLPAAPPESNPDGHPSASQSGTSEADSDAAFADHMELVRFRLKTGYYASKAINDALTDKLSGYFDELS